MKVPIMKISLTVMLLFILMFLYNVHALTINIDGQENDWTYDMGCACCSIPYNLQSKSVKLCCEDTDTPSRCQLIWVDGLDQKQQASVDLYYVRLYTSYSSIYLLIVLEPGNAANQNGAIWVNLTNPTMKISIKIDIAYNNDKLISMLNVYTYVNNIPLSTSIHKAYSRNSGYDYIEVGVGEIPLPSGSNLGISTVFGSRGWFNDDAQTPRGSTQVLIMLNDDGFICFAQYDSTTVTPIPVPEPWFLSLVSLAIPPIVLYVSRRKSGLSWFIDEYLYVY